MATKNQVKILFKEKAVELLNTSDGMIAASDAAGAGSSSWQDRAGRGH
jgi:hypothetical protein